jgi:dTDP-4-amino-4,6-dideoxygalactose transaminase
MNIPFSKVDCTGNELKYIQQVLESGWLTTAGKCAEFEKRFAEYIGVRYVCAVNSCTAALHLAAEAIGIESGDKVFVPTMTFTASGEVIRYLGGEPVILDVEYGTNLLTPETLEAAIARYPEAKAVMVVHYGGQSADMKGLIEVSNKHGLKVIEDAAHAFPTKYQDKYVGGFGNATCFSFYANKTITTGEGGMLATNDEAIYNRAKVMRLHGINRDIWDRFTSKSAKWEYDVVAPGYKYNLPDLNAAVGLAQMERAEEFRLGRQRCAEHYYKELGEVSELDLPIYRGKMEEHSWHLFSIVLNERARISRNQFIQELNSRGIGTSVHYKPIHRMTYWKERYQLRAEDFPVAERIWKGNLSLPIYPGMRPEELTYVTDTVKSLLVG